MGEQRACPNWELRPNEQSLDKGDVFKARGELML